MSSRHSRRSTAFGVLLVLIIAGMVHAAELTPKVVFKGDASTYNPNYPGYRTGGQGLATGGRYNSNAYEAALQLDRAKKYGCGYGAGKTCCAVVQEPGGKALIVKINDNGPLTAGRIIDLNEKSMQYLSGGRYGRNSGVIKNVSVAILEGKDCKLGPIDEKDRAEWASKVIDAPIDASPTPSNVFPSSIGQAYQGNQPTGGSYPTYMQPQQAQPVNQSGSGSVQPGQYFSGQSTLPSPIIASDQASLTTLADKIKSFLQGSTTESSIIPTIKPISFDTRSDTKAIISSSQKGDTTVTAGSQTITGGAQTSFVTPDLHYSAPQSNLSNPVATVLNNIKAAALRIWDVLKNL